MLASGQVFDQINLQLCKARWFFKRLSAVRADNRRGFIYHE